MNDPTTDAAASWSAILSVDRLAMRHASATRTATTALRVVWTAFIAGCAWDPTAPMNPTPIEALGAVPLIMPALVDEPFDTWNGGQWLAGNHPLGRGWVRSGNVSVQGGQLLLGLPAGTLDGGEILSSRRVRYGTYEARLKSSAAPGSITAFFLYEGARTGNDEIDIEIPGGTRQILFTVWTRGRQVHHRELTLAFDPWTAFHDYRIEHSRRAVRFFVDGVEQVEFASGLPLSQMHVMANAWWPVWLQGGPYGSDHTAAFEWIRY